MKYEILHRKLLVTC